jgi:heme A synthase
VQLAHRTLAVLLALHLISVVTMLRRRRATEAPVVVRAAYIALGFVLAQFAIAAAMILLHLPPVLRSLHEATGVGIWLSCFVLAYLAKEGSRQTIPAGDAGGAVVPPVPRSAPLTPQSMAVFVARGADPR